MTKNIYYLLALLFLAIQAQGQQNQECGVGLPEGAAIKQRMFDNRDNVRSETIEAIQNSRAITWIPVTIRIVGDGLGTASTYTDVSNVHAMFCDLNNDYASQDIQFYFNSPITYLNQQAIHEDAFSNTARTAMRNNKVLNTLNIYVGQSINNPRASFYSGGSNDFVFMLDLQTSATTSTCSHEIGHFFTLAHTFYGWEGNDYQALYGGSNAPLTIGNNRDVEIEARSGSTANCNTAADGFCDTNADYYSTRESCPYSSTGLVAQDPYGVTIAPSDSNLMSYFTYACRRDFTTDQGNAVLADIIARNWTNFTGPAVTATGLNGNSFTPISPLAGQTVPASGGFVNLTWQPITGATKYHLEIYNTIGGIIANVNSPVEKVIVNSTNYNVIVSNLTLNQTYAWRLKPLNDYSTCANYSTFSMFTFGQVTALKNIDGAQSELEMEIYPNPVGQNQDITVEIAAQQASIASFELRSIDGRVLSNHPAQAIQKGSNQFKLSLENLTTGTYILSLQTGKEMLHQKFIVQ